MSVASTLASIAEGHDGRLALFAPGRPGLSRGNLAALIASSVARLNGLGVGRGDHIAIVMLTGPEMAAAFLAIGAGAATAPLNPSYRQDEFEFYLSDIALKALLVGTDETCPAVEAAKKLRLPILRVAVAADAPAGAFTIAGDPVGNASAGGFAEASEVALLLHTSDTTSRPKLVPLTQANLAASADHIGATLALGPTDVCLNVLSLFHIHGLVAAVMASLAAGGSVFCTPGFDALKFLAWLDVAAPSWYTAVPTMHQAILARAARNEASVRDSHLRFIRSSSAPLPPRVMAELETAFRCPVIESYGMTEASHQMTSNPLPPRARVAGSVGLAAGPEVANMDTRGDLLAPGQEGEIVIRSPNVTGGYVGNPEANRAAFTDGWFRTGDQGIIDADGYLRVTGRLKEIISRGVEKVSPREIDDVLMEHPAIAQVVTFAMPSPMLGEEVAAAVVLREGAIADEQDIRRFAASRLADFKVPARF